MMAKIAARRGERGGTGSDEGRGGYICENPVRGVREDCADRSR